MARKTQMNSITSPEKTSKINAENIRLKDDFMIYLRSLRRSEGTINGYDNDLLIVFTYIMESLGNKDFRKLTKRDIVSIQNWLVNNGNSPARIRRIKSAISSLSNYCENILGDDDPDYKDYRSIVRKIESPALQPVREKTVLDDDQVEELLNILTEKKEYEKACAVALAMYSGRRKAEIVRFKVSDFSEENIVCDGALYKSAPIQTKGRSGGKYIPCYVLKRDFQPYLDRWLEYRKEHNIDSCWLFPDKSNQDQQMKLSTLNSWTRSFSKLLNVDWYWHLCRHRWTTYLVRAGLPDSVIAEIVGWSDVSLVATYTDIEADERISMYFGDGGIKPQESKSLSDV